MWRRHVTEFGYVTLIMSIVIGLYISLCITAAEYHPPISEITGTLSGLISVWLFRTRNPLAFPVGIVCSTAFAIFFYESDPPLMGQAYLNGAFFNAIQVQGLFSWLRAPVVDDDRVEIRGMSAFYFGMIVAAIIVMTAMLTGAIQFWYPQSSYPALDSSIVASSIVAQIILNYRYWENWMIWTVVNVGSIVLFSMQGYYVTVLLYIAFLMHSIIAIKTWRDRCIADSMEIANAK